MKVNKIKTLTSQQKRLGAHETLTRTHNVITLGVRKVNEMATLMGLIVDGSVWGFGASEAGALEDAVRQGHAWVRHARRSDDLFGTLYTVTF